MKNLVSYEQGKNTPAGRAILKSEPPAAAEPTNKIITLPNNGTGTGDPAGPPQQLPPATGNDGGKLKSKRAVDVLATHYEALQQAVDGLVCEGLTLLVGASKVGKSWFILLMCLCVAAGRDFLQRKTTQGDVLYIALEDSERRLKQRMQTIGMEVSPGLHYMTKAPFVEDGLLIRLQAWIDEHPSTRLIVIDTLQKVRGMSPSRANAYQADYQFMTPIKDFADKNHVAVVMVHHLNKLRAVEDVFDKISGSTGLMGAADTTIMIDRKRGENTASVQYVGRDVYGDDFSMSFENGIWKLVTGDAIEIAERAAYERSDLVKLIRAIASDFPNGTRLTYKDLKKEGIQRINASVAIDGKDLSRKLDALADQLVRYDGIRVELGLNVTGGKGLSILPVKKAPLITVEV